MYVYMQVDALQEEVRKLQVLQKDLETKLTLLEGQVSWLCVCVCVCVCVYVCVCVCLYLEI